MKSKQPIVIIGGMGPQASSTLYRLLIDKATSEHKVIRNEDYPHVVIESLPVPDFISSRERQVEAIEIMADAVERITQHSPCAVGIACNTAHLFIEDIGINNENLPFTSLIEVVAQSVADERLSKVGLLSSPTTVATGLYGDALARHNIECVTPNRLQLLQVEDVIRDVIAGRAGKRQARILAEVANSLIDRGAEAIILGCTELPLVFDKSSISQPTFDCLDLMAEALLERYYQQYAILEQI